MFKKMLYFFAFIGVGAIVLANTPYMNLPNPTPGVTPGPQWATDISSSLNTIDGHTHAPGSGRQVGVAGLNINVDLPINNNDINNARSYRMANNSQTLTEPTDVRNAYFANGNFYVNSNSGVPVQITNGNTLNVGPSTGGFGGDYIGAGAQASYFTVGNRYTFMGPSNTAANMQCSANFTAAGTATITGATTSGSPLAVTGSIANLNILDSDVGTTDYQWSVNASNISLNADTNNDLIFDVQNIIYANATGNISVNGAANSAANFTVSGNGPSIQIGTNATSANNFYYYSSGSGDLNIYGGTFPSSNILQQTLNTGEVAFNGYATAGRGFNYYTANEIAFSLNYANNYNGRNYFSAQKARGTLASPTAVQLGDILGGVSMGGHDGNGWTPDAAAVISTVTDAWDGTQHSADLRFLVTPIESTSTYTAAVLDSYGNFYPGTATQTLGTAIDPWDSTYSDNVITSGLNATGGSATGLTSVSGTTITSTNPYQYSSLQTITQNYSVIGATTTSDTTGTVSFSSDGVAVLFSGNAGTIACITSKINVPYDPNVTTTLIGGQLKTTMTILGTATNALSFEIRKRSVTDYPSTASSRVGATTNVSTGGVGTYSFNGNNPYTETIGESTYYFYACCRGGTGPFDSNTCQLADFSLTFTTSAISRGQNN